MNYAALIMIPALVAVAEAGQGANTCDASGLTPLMRYVRNSALRDDVDADKVRALIAAGADVNARDNEGNTALMLAPSIRYYGHELHSGLPIVKALVEAGADVHAL
ncbi:MAG: hypothetical protein IJ993_04140, partial [Akkermansia sp.]|nr:hypothetical protein [Akkermansia sp.]